VRFASVSKYLLKIEASQFADENHPGVTSESGTVNTSNKSVPQTGEKSTLSAKKSHNLTESEAERAAQDAAEVEAFRNQQDEKRSKSAVKHM